MVGLGRLFATTLIYRLSPFPFPRSLGCGGGCFQSWDGLPAFPVPMFSLMQQVLTGLESCKEVFLPCLPRFSLLEWILDLLSLSVASPVAIPYRIDLLWQPTSFFCTRTSACFIFFLGETSAFCLLSRSSRHLCQRRWDCFGDWCYSRDYSVSSLSVSEIAGFCSFLVRRISSLSTLKGFHSFFPSVFEYELPVLQVGSVFWDLLRSFEVMRFLLLVGPPS